MIQINIGIYEKQTKLCLSICDEISNHLSEAKHIVLYVSHAGGHLHYEKCVRMNGLFIMQMSNE